MRDAQGQDAHVAVPTLRPASLRPSPHDVDRMMLSGTPVHFLGLPPVPVAHPRLVGPPVQVLDDQTTSLHALLHTLCAF
jgi:hypothetical protein